MISSIFMFYIFAMVLLLTFETTTRYIQTLYYMVLVSNIGGLFMLRALHKSVEKYQKDLDVSCGWRRVYGTLSFSYTMTILFGLGRERALGTRCSEEVIYPYSFLGLMF